MRTLLSVCNMHDGNVYIVFCRLILCRQVSEGAGAVREERDRRSARTSQEHMVVYLPVARWRHRLVRRRLFGVLSKRSQAAHVHETVVECCRVEMIAIASGHTTVRCACRMGRIRVHFYSRHSGALLNRAVVLGSRKLRGVRRRHVIEP